MEVPDASGYFVYSDGTIWSTKGRQPRRLRTWPDRNGYLVFAQALGASGVKRNRYVHIVVCEAFHGPRPEGLEARHLNGDHTDNRPENLAWGTVKQNRDDTIEHGHHYWANLTHCRKEGHPFTPENTYVHPVTGHRVCKACRRVSQRKYERVNR